MSRSYSLKSPLEGLYAFVRNHLAVVNALVLASGTIVAILDFLAPRISVLPRVLYSFTFGLVVLMALAAIAPTLVSRMLAAVGLVLARNDSFPLWRRPTWQVGVTLLTAVTIAGYVSVAKAGQGGLLASASPAVRGWQEDLLSLREEAGEIGAGVRQANDKLDRVVASVDPSNVADRCPDLECALQGGASSRTILRLFERGAKVPGNPLSDGELLRMAAISRGEGRFESIDLLFQHGVSRDARFFPNYLSPGMVSRAGLKWARQVDEIAGSTRNLPAAARFNPTGDEDLGVWNDAVGCFYTSSGGVTLLELAALLEDQDLARHLIEGGSKLLARPLICTPKWRKGYARVVIDPVTGKVLGVKGSPS